MNFILLAVFIIVFGFPVSVKAQENSSVSVVSCPIPGGSITTPSYQASQISGHCGGGYSFSCNCGTNGRRAKAIDISTGGKDAVLPMIEGKTVEWTLLTKNYSVEGGEGGGVGNTFKASVGSDNWYLDILHLNSTSLQQGQSYPSGTAIGKSVISHAHATIGKNLKEPVAAGSASDCDPGWLPSDFMCDPSKQPPTTTTEASTDTTATSSGGSGKSNVVCTKVGNPVAPTPAACINSSPVTGGGGIAGPDGFVFYCQGNTAWGSNCSLGSAGCGPSSLAMILSTFGVNMNPPQVDAEFRRNGWRGCGDVGSMLTTAIQSSWLKGLGFTTGPDLLLGNYLDASEAKKFLDEGYLIIASSAVFPCANCRTPGATVNHIFVVDGIDTVARVVDIRDPNNCSYADGNDEDPNKRIKGITSFPWLYAYPIKKLQ